MSTDSEVSKSSMVDRKRQSYATFYDFAWHGRLVAITKGNADLERIFLDLGLCWREASNLQYMPSHSVHLLEVWANANEPYGFTFKSTFVEKVMRKVGDFNRTKQQQVRKAIEEVADALHQFVQQPGIKFDGDTFWHDSFASNQEITYMLRGCQRLCYGAVYFAYENFLLQIYQTVSGDIAYEIRKAEQFGKDLAKQLGQPICDHCWSHPDVIFASLVRNALVHNGSRETPQLKKQKAKSPPTNDIAIHNGEFQILPKDTGALHDLLKDRVEKVATAAIGKIGAPGTP